MSSLASYLNQFPRQRFLQAASDFHFLLYIATMDMLPLWVIITPITYFILLHPFTFSKELSQ